MVNPPKTPLKFGQEEKPNKLKKILFWGFVVIAVVGIGLMIKLSPHQGTLNCSSGGSGSWSSFGRCHED
jgi:hypothetical protein